MSSVARLRQEAALAKRAGKKKASQKRAGADGYAVDYHGYAVYKATPQQKKLNFTELQQNWKGRTGLSSRESDLQYKYHVARLSGVYRGKAKVDNKPPRTAKDPPYWSTTAKDLSPNPGLIQQLQRERRWDERFYVQDTSSPSQTKSRVRPKSAVEKRSPAMGGRTNNGKMSATTQTRRRPVSATPNLIRNKSGEHEDQSQGMTPNARSVSHLHRLSDEERDMLEGRYHFNPDQAETYKKFTEMLSEFDVSLMMTILEDTLRDAQKCSMFADYDGTELV